MKMKLKQAVDIYTSIKNEASNCEDISTKFRLIAILNSLVLIVETYDTLRSELILKYGTKNENGDISIDTNDEKSFNDFKVELNKLLDQDVSLTIDKIKFKDIANLDINLLIQLYPIMEE